MELSLQALNLVPQIRLRNDGIVFASNAFGGPNRQMPLVRENPNTPERRIYEEKKQGNQS